MSVKCLVRVGLAGLFLTLVTAQVNSKPDLKGIPSKVMDALKARFPNPEIQKWTKAEEGGVVLYDIEFTQGGNKMEADIKEDGTIANWERAIPVKKLPAAVTRAMNSRYNKAVVKEVMATTTVKNGKDVPEGYEITLHTVGGKAVEITVAPNGKVVEDSAAKN